MQRKDFIKRISLASVSFSLLGNSPQLTPRAAKNCTETPEETDGPFPTHKPSDLVAQNIISDRVGTSLIINIGLYDTGNNCKALQNAIIDIWHCDSKGEYSEYGGGDMKMPAPGTRPPEGVPGGPRGRRPPGGGGMMQAADHQSEHFLRGRQVTNPNGLVSFKSIYPGWYPGRSPHVHVHVYNAAGKSLLITQIAFPEEVSLAVYGQVDYASHGQPDTSHSHDMVFEDSIANELGTITGNIKDGYVLSHSIYVKA